MYHINFVIPPKRIRIVTHSSAAPFSIKTCLDKTNNIFDSKTKAIYLNLVIAYESKLNIKITSPWTKKYQFLKVTIKLHPLREHFKLLCPLTIKWQNPFKF